MPPEKAYLTMTELALRTLRERILEGVYAPGQKLMPNELEAELGLGRVAIREALRELSGSGLVVSLPNRGAHVADPPTWSELEVMFEARYLLEGRAAFRACTRMTPEALTRIETLHQMEQASYAKFKNWFLLNRKFHMEIYKASGWDHICRAIGQLYDQILSYRAQILKEIVEFAPFTEDHAHIVQALKNREAEEVKRLVVANIHRGYEQAKASRKTITADKDRDEGRKE
ncbi:MAG: GntR family transcriptional regulator [Desulfarculaceae bacterium]|jgi:DNA-binding GntR family transcriptional regulator